LLNKRNSQSKDEILEKSDQIFKIIVNLPEYQQAENIIIYCGKDEEVQTEKIIKYSLNDGKKIIVPITNVQKRVLEFSEIKDFDQDLEISTFDIPEPKKDRYKPFDLDKIDLIFVPGVGFDKIGGRLGYGYGYFDKFLSSIINRKIDKFIPFIGLAFDLQIVEILPTGKNDINIDLIITEKRIINSHNR
jgi:5-formyltetrahydrofolate cyclo-ligase